MGHLGFRDDPAADDGRRRRPALGELPLPLPDRLRPRGRRGAGRPGGMGAASATTSELGTSTVRPGSWRKGVAPSRVRSRSCAPSRASAPIPPPPSPPSRSQFRSRPWTETSPASLARLHAIPGDPRTGASRAAVETAAEEFLNRRSPGDHNQALMELGALVCLPRSPRCEACPLARRCLGLASGRPEASLRSARESHRSPCGSPPASRADAGASSSSRMSSSFPATSSSSRRGRRRCRRRASPCRQLAPPDRAPRGAGSPPPAPSATPSGAALLGRGLRGSRGL